MLPAHGSISCIRHFSPCFRRHLFHRPQGLPQHVCLLVSYWWSQVGETALRALVAIQILGNKLVAYRVKILLWSMYLVFCLIAVFALGFPIGMTGVMLQIIIISDLLSAIVLAIAVCWPYIWWHDVTGYSALTFGLLFSMCSDSTLFLVRFKIGLAYLPYIRAALPRPES